MKKFCLVGKDISYSLSPAIHREIYRIWGADAVYGLEDISEDRLPQIIADYDGLNITKPYKLKVGAYLDEIENTSVNTVVKINGETVGKSTDGEGFWRALKKTGGDKFNFYAVVGGGGAAVAIAQTLGDKNKNYEVFARNQGQAEKLSALKGGRSGDAASKPKAIIYCASGGNYLPFDTSETEYLMDLRYDGSEITSNKFFTVNGLLMLVEQAVLSAANFLSVDIDEKQIDETADIIYNKLVRGEL